MDYLFDPVLEEMRDNMLIKEEYVQYSHIVLGAVRRRSLISIQIFEG